ncbi:TraB/GumN family protein [Fulvivirga lutimaris]|uniref:TraB/GumN family protein n=1 Tax=Fulvivirga lutimaris TaxID=1819566 RepID=UPI0012BBD650|nr:TraB/GumN family protein [Fulvivirga lutimaris]MTI41459.1 TraB/GumN family protein [Fulvivirga lutimaris]
MKVDKHQKMFKIVLKLLVFSASFLVGMLLFRTTHAQDANALLWKIEGKDLKKPSYIYGTIHIICKDDFFVTDAVKKAQSETELTVLELDMDDPEFMQKIQQGSMNEGMKNIVSEFTDEQKEIANTFFKANYGADLSQLGIVKPFALLSMVVQKSVPCTTPESYEATFVKNAQERNVEVLGLETVEFQTSLFDNEPLAKQIKLLITTIEEFDEAEAEFTKLVGAYKNQDLKALQQIMADSPEYAEFEDLLLGDRNKAWIAKIEAFIKEQPTFFGVGALHLAGENGVLTLLKKEGYKVSPVK